MRSISANIVSYLEDGDKLRIMDVGALGGMDWGVANDYCRWHQGSAAFAMAALDRMANMDDLKRKWPSTIDAGAFKGQL